MRYGHFGMATMHIHALKPAERFRHDSCRAQRDPLCFWIILRELMQLGYAVPILAFRSWVYCFTQKIPLQKDTGRACAAFPVSFSVRITLRKARNFSAFCYRCSKRLPPWQSMAVIKGKSSNHRRLTDSQPRSSKAITSQDLMHLQASAPAPPMAQK